nr:hypothetical protein [Tanacetum cinerariifolium]
LDSDTDPLGSPATSDYFAGSDTEYDPKEFSEEDPSGDDSSDEDTSGPGPEIPGHLPYKNHFYGTLGCRFTITTTINLTTTITFTTTITSTFRTIPLEIRLPSQSLDLSHSSSTVALPPRKRCKVSSYSSPPPSVRQSLKRCSSPTAPAPALAAVAPAPTTLALSSLPADLLPHRKRFRAIKRFESTSMSGLSFGRGLSFASDLPCSQRFTNFDSDLSFGKAGSKDRPPMLATWRYAQWQSRFLRYIDTRPNGDALRKCILEGPYKLTTVTISAIPATDDSPEVLERTAVETLLNMSLENKEHYQSEKKAIKLVYQKEVNEIRAERIAKNANPLALVAVAQPYTDSYYQAPKSQNHMHHHKNNHFPPDLMHLPNTKVKRWPNQSHLHLSQFLKKTVIQNKLKEIRICRKNLTLISKYFKKIYKPTNNNLKTSSNFRNKNVDTSPRYKNDNQTRQFRNQRTVTVAGARKTVGSQVVQQTGIQCFNCNEFGHLAKECRKPKRIEDYTYHKKKMLLYKQAEKGVPLQVEKAEWLEDTDEEINEQELEAHYSYMAKI